MKKIFLSNGQVTLVSDEDYIFLFPYNWHNSSNSGYVVAWIDGKDQYMHRMVAVRMKLNLTKGEVDHADRNKLNNQRSNLRVATKQQNQANSVISKNNTSGYKGVHQRKNTGRWRARIEVNHEYIHLGYFDTSEEAHHAYCKAAKHYFGEFARSE